MNTISRSLVLAFRRAMRGWYSAAVYQRSRESMSGNSMITTRSGFQRPPSGNLWVSPFVLTDAGIEPTLDSNPEKFRRSLAADVALWTPTVKALGLKIE